MSLLVERAGVDRSGVDALTESIICRFSAMALAYPSAVSIIQDGRAVTYSELDERSNQFAWYLRRLGVGAGDVVALVAGRSISSLISIIGILKLGAAYAPFDPVSPPELLQWAVKDCGAIAVLTEGVSDYDLSAPTLVLDQAISASRVECPFAHCDKAAPEDIAYVMYTSGSTGRPKGVLVPHRGVVRLVIDQSYAHFGPDEVVLHAAPLAFDASTFEIWAPLLHGGRGVIVTSDRPSLHEIAEAIKRNDVTTAWFTAGLFHLLVERKLQSLTRLRQIIAGGDVLSPTHVLRALEALPDCQLINGYGPTENTTFTCCYRIPKSGWGGGPVPIGAPIEHTYICLLNDDMSPVADGEVGQLYTGGLGLASGYVSDAPNTSVKFVPDPQRAGALLYQTGDLARRRPDRMLDFIGRTDRQVKIDGKRIEPGEIEEVLRRNPSVADAIVTVAKNELGAVTLAAYIKAASAAIDAAELVANMRSDLQGSLPAHMRPSQIIVVEEFPLTSNGKVAYDRLPSPRLVHRLDTPTKGQLESAMARIFCAALRVHTIGLDSNFFDLGATSLQLIEAHALIEELHGDLSVLALFEYPTIRKLTAHVRGNSLQSATHGDRGQANHQRNAMRRARAAKLQQ